MRLLPLRLLPFLCECGIGDRRPRFDGAARRNRPPRPCGTIGRDGRDRHNGRDGRDRRDGCDGRNGRTGCYGCDGRDGRDSAGIIREKHQIHRKKISKQRIHSCFLI